MEIKNNEAKVFKSIFNTYYDDTDAQGVIYYANYLRLAERARTDALRSLGVSQTKLMQETGCFFVVKNCNIDYVNPAFLDDVLTIVTVFDELANSSLKAKQLIMKDHTIVAKLECLAVFVKRDPEGTISATRIPKEIRDLL